MEADAVDGDVDARSRQVAVANEVMDPVDHFVVGDLVGRALMVARQISDGAGVGLLGSGGQTADGHVALVFFS
jgi:hypothetical protein